MTSPESAADHRASEPLVTVIVPGYNVAAYVDEALASLRAQTLPQWRAILVDDASTDDTGERFAVAAASDPRFTLVRHPEQRGLGAARNSALDQIASPFVAFLDADDVMAPGALELLVGSLTTSGSDFVVGAYSRLRPDAAGAYSVSPVQPWVSASTDPARSGTTLAAHPEVVGNIVAWSKLSRADVWRDLRFPEGRLYEDQVVAQQMYTRARAFDVVPDVVVHWRVRADDSSITQREAELSVLRDCLDQMVAGISVLENASQPAAARARSRQILRMDVPRLAAIASTHPDAHYRRALGDFTRAVWGREPDARPELDDEASRAVSAALLW